MQRMNERFPQRRHRQHGKGPALGPRQQHLDRPCRSRRLHRAARTPSQLAASSSGESAQKRSVVTPSARQSGAWCGEADRRASCAAAGGVCCATRHLYPRCGAGMPIHDNHTLACGGLGQRAPDSSRHCRRRRRRCRRHFCPSATRRLAQHSGLWSFECCSGLASVAAGAATRRMGRRSTAGKCLSGVQQAR